MIDDKTDNTSFEKTLRPRSGRSWRAWLLMSLILVSGLTVDLWSKSYAFAHVADVPVDLNRTMLLMDQSYQPVPQHAPVALLPGHLLNARLVVNFGAVFGLGQHRRFFFIAFTIAAIIIGLVLFARWTREHHRLAHVAIGFILAGGLGNLYDRAVIGAVRDFLHMVPEARLPFGWHWPGGNPDLFPWVFNMADAMLLFGMLLLMIHINRIENRRQKKAAAEHETVEAEENRT